MSIPIDSRANPVPTHNEQSVNPPTDGVSAERLQELIEWHSHRIGSGALSLTCDSLSALRELQERRAQSPEPGGDLDFLLKVEAAARALIKTGLRNNGEHLIVVEKPDRSDPHYRLCELLDPRPPRSTPTKEAKP